MSPAFKLLVKIFLLAMAYFGTGLLGLQLALPPGFATSFWPPAGIALAALLIFGSEVWPGLFIGSFLIGVAVQLKDNHSVQLATFFWPALFQAIGVSLQGLISEKLIRRFVGFPCALNEEKTIGKFLFLGGPIGCTVSATISVGALCAFGVLPWASFAFIWGTWWVGDSIGVMIVTPLALMFADNSKQIFSNKHLSILIPSLFVLTVTIFMYVKVSQWEQEKIEGDLKGKANLISSEIERRLDSYVGVLESIKGLFASSKSVDKAEFRQFVKGTLQRYPDLQALSWDIRFKEADRAKLIQKFKLAGEKLDLKELSPDGMVTDAHTMSEYMVPIYIEPESTNAPALGYNLYSNESRKNAIQTAIRNGKAATTDRIRLIQETGNQFGLLIVLPIYANDKSTATEAEREKNALGVVVGVVRIEDFMNGTLVGFSLDGMNFEVEDLSAPSALRALYNTDGFYSKQVSSRDLKWSTNITVANRVWKINFIKSYAALMEKRPWQAWFVLAAGLLFTGLFTAFLMVIIGRTSRIEDLVEKRTQELAEAKSNMISASKMSALGEMAGGMAHEINTPLTIINLKVAQLEHAINALNIKDEKIDEGLKKIEDTVARIAKIIRGLRYFARDAKNDSFENVQVKSILDDTLYLCTERFRHNGIMLKTAPCPEDLYIECRGTEISQVILNLLNNSCDAIMDLPEKWIEIKIVKKNRILEIRITDSGGGIQPDVQEKIMQPFFTTKPVGKGTGLGLSISKGIIESHRGSLSIDETSMNTCFVITLPIQQIRSS